MPNILYRYVDDNLVSWNPRVEWLFGSVWMPKLQHIELNSVGYHTLSSTQLLQGMTNNLYAVEVRGNGIVGTDSSCWQEARLIRKIESWDSRALRHFAADCLARQLLLLPNKDLGTKIILALRGKLLRVSLSELQLEACNAAVNCQLGDSAAMMAKIFSSRPEVIPQMIVGRLLLTYQPSYAHELVSREKQWQLKQLHAYLDGVAEEVSI